MQYWTDDFLMCRLNWSSLLQPRVWYGNLFENKWAALLNDISPNVLNYFMGGTTDSAKLAARRLKDDNLSGNCVPEHVTLWSKDGKVYILSLVWLAVNVIVSKEVSHDQIYFFDIIILPALLQVRGGAPRVVVGTVVLVAQFSLCVRKSDLKPASSHFFTIAGADQSVNQ